MRKILLFVLPLFFYINSFAQSYWEVTKVFDLNEVEESKSTYLGFPIMIQLSGSAYTGFNAYVCVGNFGNIILANTGSQTNDGYFIYANQGFNGYSLTDNRGKPNYLLYGISNIVHASSTCGRIFIAKSINYQTYIKKVSEINRISPYIPRGIGGKDKSSKSSCGVCNGTGKIKQYGPDYTGQGGSVYYIKCPACR